MTTYQVADMPADRDPVFGPRRFTYPDRAIAKAQARARHTGQPVVVFAVTETPGGPTIWQSIAHF